MSQLRVVAFVCLGWLSIAEPGYATPPAADASVPPAKAETTLAPEAQKQAWLSGKLSGGDNRMAARRTVQIESREGRYTLFIKNQFALRCWVAFDAAGDPTQLSDCKSGDSADWDATGPITLSCREQTSGRICSGKWHSKNGIIAPDTLSFQRSSGKASVKPKAAAHAQPASERPPRCPKGARCAIEMGGGADDF